MCTSVVDSVPAGLPTIDPEELHRYLLKCHRLENRVRYRFLQGLYAIEVGQLYLKLGAESTQEYADEHFGWKPLCCHPSRPPLRGGGCDCAH